ncbi:RNA polymerase sigma factor ECF family 11 [Psychrosphaera saromensis]|uniref:RNA polymerase subunit sigma n=1 Tax=Psychrosphaera saromensis TaxID=716813 RepID=A0A2S7UX17_9GAMM|nr:sigma-70 family RNA polymerase sigma factor [Psychrosphaera saromensis]PQJ54544.1 RNA polymerase subunit sigma [Psychrosphaera saromensis]GHB59070.1 RNA polymerase sigma factor ECF family 11 [Psychrosphaera saromensis]GLQ14246.1 RNA polymerase sigma factor ECF family 11 [Psychrosphaera saromensis]
MQVVQSNLSNKITGHIISSMHSPIQNTDICSWLHAVAKSRDKSAFTQLFHFFAPKILKISQSKLSNKTLANEVVQETMSNVWKKAHLFDDAKGAPTTWIFTIMRNVTFDILRKLQSNKEDNLSDDIWPMIEMAEVEHEPFSDHLEQKQILSVIDKLPQNQQEVIKGFYFMEMSQDQLAVHLDLPVGTVKSRLRLALIKLRGLLGVNND